MARTDKKFIWSAKNIAVGANANWAKDETVLKDNSTGEVNITIESIDGQMDVRSNSDDIYYYGIIFVTDPGGTVPTGLIGDDAALQTWLDTYRKQVWMTMGGMCEFNAGIGPKTEVLFSAETKRVLMPGQKLVLVRLARNASGVGPQTVSTCADFTMFFGY